MIDMERATIRIIEGHPKDRSLSRHTTFGLSITVGKDTETIEDISDDRSALEHFADKLRTADFALSVVRELIDDFLTDRYGI